MRGSTEEKGTELMKYRGKGRKEMRWNDMADAADHDVWWGRRVMMSSLRPSLLYKRKSKNQV